MFGRDRDKIRILGDIIELTVSNRPAVARFG